MERLCCFFNYNPLYRYPIYHSMDKEMRCDFYFGDNVFQPLKQFPPEMLHGYKKTLKTIRTHIKDYKWHRGIAPMFRGYSDYLITGQLDYISNWLLILFAKLTGKRIYCWSHGASKFWTRKPVGRFVTRLFFKSMDGIFLYNNYKIEFMKELGIEESKLHVIHNSMDTTKQTQLFNYLRKKEGNPYSDHFGNNLPTIVYIGRIQAYKKLNMLIDAVSILNKKERSVNLIIVGSPTDDFSLEKYCKEKKQEDAVWLYGACFDEEKNAELLYHAAVCVCPVAVGLTAVHALSYGTPVITNDDFEHQGPEFEAIKDGVTGSFYRTGSIEELTEKIAYWIKKNPAEREITRSCARQEVETQWSVDFQMQVLKQQFPQYIKR